MRNRTPNLYPADRNVFAVIFIIAFGFNITVLRALGWI